MALPAPNLDDRRFQDLVDEAKRMVMRRCPGWTDHNVSDPGVTLIETFAYMVDQLLYRVNRVPDRLYVKFLDLLGLRIFPPTPAHVSVTFWLSAPAVSRLSVAGGAEVGTLRTEADESVVFSLLEGLEIVPCSLQSVRTRASSAAESVDQRVRVDGNAPFKAFSAQVEIGDLLMLGLSDAVPAGAVRIDFQGAIEGVGINPKYPPLVWEAWTADGWVDCVVSSDETGGLNQSGSFVLHLPGSHEVSVIDEQRAGWVRGRVVEPKPGQPPYSASPVIHGLTVCTVGATGECVNAEIVRDEVVGESDGVSGQVFAVSSRPILGGLGETVVEVSSDDGWQEWTAVDNFAASGAHDRHFMLDAFAGEVHFGPLVRMPDGVTAHYGAVPEKGATVRLRRYATGGGARGNVGAGTVRTLKSSIPFVARVENLEAAQGGVDGETLEEAKRRGPMLLHTRNRAVTAEDFEILAQEAAPDIARVRCLTAGEGDVGAGQVKVLVVPAGAATAGRVDFADLVPTPALLKRIAARLDKVRLVGTQVLIEPPFYRAVTAVVKIIAQSNANKERVRQDALEALYLFLNPLPGGGPNGDGWPFGRPVRAVDLHAVLQNVRGVEFVDDVRLFSANPVTGERGRETPRIDLEPTSLIFSFDHKVRVEQR